MENREDSFKDILNGIVGNSTEIEMMKLTRDVLIVYYKTRIFLSFFAHFASLICIVAALWLWVADIIDLWMPFIIVAVSFAIQLVFNWSPNTILKKARDNE